MAADDKVVIGLTHAADDAESVLISYLLGVEALRAGKEALMWLTKDGIKVATDGFAETVHVEGGSFDRRPPSRVRRKGWPLLRLPGLRQDPQDGGRRLDEERRGQGRSRHVRVRLRRRADVQLLTR